MRIAVLGYSGSGKSTLAKSLADHHNIPVLYLDTVQFLPGWQERDRGEAAAMVAAFMEQDSWVIDGNYTGFLQAQRLEQADQVVLLSFNRFNCLLRAWRRYRTFRNRTRESMAQGCNEKIDLDFVWWILYQGRTAQVRQHFRDIQTQYAHKCVVLKNQRQLDGFLQKLRDSLPAAL